MPTIGRADIEVHYDGKGLPREARALGEETGAAAGEAHAKEFDKEVVDGQSRTGKKLEAKWDANGRKIGERTAKSFTDAFDELSMSKVDQLAKKMAAVFSDEGGIEKYRKSLGGVGKDYEGISHTADDLQRKITLLYDNKQLDYNLFKRLSTDIKTWAGEAKKAEDALKQLDFDEAWAEAVRYNDEIEQGSAQHDKFAASARNIKNAIDDYNESERIHNGLMKDGESRTTGMRNAIEELHGAMKRLNPDLDTHRDLLDRINHTLGDGGTEDHYRGLAKEAGKLGDEAGKMARKVEGAGKSIERSGGHADKASGKFGKFFKLFSNFDPGDNLGQLFLIILSFAGPLAGLISALGAQMVILGTAGVAAGVGVGLAAVAFSNILGPVGKLPASVRPAADAIQDLFHQFGGLRDVLQEGLFGAGQANPFTDAKNSLEGVGGSVKTLATKLMPVLKGSFTDVGKALGGVVLQLTRGLQTPESLKTIDALFRGFSPIIRDVGSVVLHLGDIIAQTMKAALPYAQALTGNLRDAFRKFDEFLQSANGQNTLKKWFEDTRPVVKALGGVIEDAAKAFAILVTPSTMADAVILLDDIGQMVIDLATVGTALSPLSVAIGDALTIVTGVLSALSPVIEGVGNVVSAAVDSIKPIVSALTTALGPVFDTIGKALDTVANGIRAVTPVWEGFWGGAAAMIKPVTGFISDIYNGLLDFINKGIKIAAPALSALGDAFSDIGGAVGLFLDSLFGAAENTSTFKDTAKTSADFLNGPFKSAVGNVTGFFKDISRAIKTDVIPSIKEIDWSLVTKGLDSLFQTVPHIVDMLGQIIKAFAANISAGAAWATAIGASVSAVATNIHAVGTVISDVLTGNFGALAVDGPKALKDVGKAGVDLKNSISDAMSKTGKAIDTTNDAQKRLNQDSQKVRDGVKGAFKDFSDAGKGNLGDLAKKMGLTGESAAAFRGVVRDQASKAGVDLKNLADSKGLPDLEKRLGITGDAAKSKFEAKIKSAAGVSGDALDKLPPKAQAIIKKLGELDGTKATPKINLTGDTQAISKVDSVRNALQRINGSTATVSIISRQVGQGTAAVGGVMAGGQLIAGGKIKAFASGGVVNYPTLFGNTLTGEGGPEAIVPLSGALSSVDKSVRGLAAYARGMVAPSIGAGSGAPASSGPTIAPGAIVVQEAGNGRTTASAVLDRITARLG